MSIAERQAARNKFRVSYEELKKRLSGSSSETKPAESGVIEPPPLVWDGTYYLHYTQAVGEREPFFIRQLGVNRPVGRTKTMLLGILLLRSCADLERQAGRRCGARYQLVSN